VVLAILVVAFSSYLLGSFPAGYIAGRIAGVDVRTVGSGNIGATNVLRTLGKRFGYPVFLIDALKGFVAVRLAIFIAGKIGVSGEYTDSIAIFATVSCVIGHSFPVWLRFRGGKGVATLVGALFALMPIAAVIGICIWVIVFETTRYVSVASMTAAAALPLGVAVLLWMKVTNSLVLLYFSIAMAALVIWRHRSNLSRLLRGTEQRFSRK
jgi:acyl phosphate:glycerol-3-phosphate acyltransferase